ncbi:acyl-CoA dehydrogenase family protein [Baaleninema simplex]|uniref:acyl-CoA dehydrogenase family protein n=1 Tax=Baaleninema simplex TaxID=2862350 RepID=UPI00034A1735|nr:acyl-CoA dehydrogenase family protein [Baaleninema simplex]
MTAIQTPLDLAETYLRENVAANANEIDRNPDALRHALQGLGDRSLLSLRADNPEAFRRFQETITRYSGALAFLQTQHQSAAAMLAKSRNETLKQTYLPNLASGKRLLGVGFSQLRRRRNPPLTAVSVEGGYRLNGFVPWVTGWNFFEAFVVGAMLPDGSSLFGMMPLTNSQQPDGGAIAFSEPMAMAALTSTNTVTANVENWFLSQDEVLFVKPPNWMESNSKTNVLHHSFFALGCARGGLDVLADVAAKKSLPFIRQAWENLDRELSDCRHAIFDAELESIKSYDDRLKLRAWAIDLAVRCATAAVSASSGASNASHHPAQRVYREALVFSVSGQTHDVMAATLDRLVRH